MESRYIDLDGPVHYVDFGGDGPVVVLVHGLGGSHVNWVGLGPLLARRARVLAVDLAGFGRTPPAGRSTSVHANRRLLDAFLREVAGTPVILLGNSMGGMISILEADAQPDHVAGLVLVDPSLPRAPGTGVDREIAAHFVAYALPGVGARYLGSRRRRLGVHGVVRETLRVCCADPKGLDQGLYDAAVAMAEERSRMPWADAAFIDAARSILGVLARGRRYRDVITSLPQPTLLVHGALDRLVSATSARHIAQLRPDWVVEILDGVGHVPQLEAPMRVAACIEEWFDGPGAAAVEAATPSKAGEPAER